MIRAVLDTNLIVSYLLTRGHTTSRIIDHWEQGTFIYLVTPAIMVELRDVLTRPRLRKYMSSDPQVLLDVIENDAEHIAGDLTLQGVCRDPKDDRFIACAVEGNAGYIVTGDADLLELTGYRDIHIVTPVEFVALLDKQT